MSSASSDASMLVVAAPAPLRPTLLAVDSCTHQYANLLVPGQIVSFEKNYLASQNVDNI
jgi:hypothetical protein